MPEFIVDWERIPNDATTMLRLEAGHNPHDQALIELISKLDLDYESTELPSEPGLTLNVYGAAVDAPAATRSRC